MTVDFDVARLESWLKSHVPHICGPISISRFPGGQSNPTYRIQTPTANYVLRRKPFGDLLPSAHAVDREYRLLSTLHPTGFPVPRPIALCQGSDVIGAQFYIMEMVEGCTYWDGALPEKQPAERKAIYEEMVRTLARLHMIDVAGAGLSDFGRPGNYFERQIARWTRQYRASQTEDIPEVEKLIDWLPATVPPQTRTSLIHGDYRIDNIIMSSAAPRALAVIDWELATIGDPLADFAYLAMNWIMPLNGRSGLFGTDFSVSGIPALEDMIDLYCAETNRDAIPSLHWYFAYNLFRLTGIVQGMKHRMLNGNASSATVAEGVKQLVPLAQAAWQQAGIADAKSLRKLSR